MPLQEVGAHVAPQDASGGPCCRRVLACHRKERQGGGSGGCYCLKLPLVATSTFSFEEVEDKLLDSQEWEPLEQSGAQGALSPKSVSSDTPKATVDAWNGADCVALLLVAKDEICGAQVTDGEVNFKSFQRPS